MGKSKNQISIETFNEWLASTGYLFPSNPTELTRFEKLYEDFDYQLSPDLIDPIKIINGTYNQQVKKTEFKQSILEANEFNIAARNIKEIPDRILKKIKNNSNGLKSCET